MIDLLEPVGRLLLQPMAAGLIVLVLGAIVAGHLERRWGWGLVVLGILIVWLPATTLVAIPLAGSLEARHLPEPVSEVPTADAIVVLGGSAGAAHPPRLAPDLHAASDRLWHAARLYRAGKAPVVIASGGGEDTPAEAPVMREVLTAWGVPDSVIVEEPRSQSTYENARYTAEILAERGGASVLLVTSAMHMSRAQATFRAMGVEVHPSTTDVRITSETEYSLWPDVEALAATTRALHEYAAILAYGWAGRFEDQRLGAVGR